jgi:hypothetical protein
MPFDGVEPGPRLYQEKNAPYSVFGTLFSIGTVVSDRPPFILRGINTATIAITAIAVHRAAPANIAATKIP